MEDNFDFDAEFRVRLPSALAERIAETAKKERRSRNQQYVYILENWYELKEYLMRKAVIIVFLAMIAMAAWAGTEYRDQCRQIVCAVSPVEEIGKVSNDRIRGRGDVTPYVKMDGWIDMYQLRLITG